MGGKEACIKPHNEWLHPPWFTLSFNIIERKPDQLWNSVRYMTRHATSARKQESGCWRRRTTKTAKEGLGIKMRCLFFFLVFLCLRGTLHFHPSNPVKCRFHIIQTSINTHTFTLFDLAELVFGRSRLAGWWWKRCKARRGNLNTSPKKQTLLSEK